MPKIYDKNIKTEAVKRYKNGENIDKIANDLNIKAGSQLIRIWYKSSKSCYSYSIYKDCKEVKLMSQKLKKDFISKELKEKNKENKLLKDRIKKLEKNLKFEIEEKMLAIASKEILEKSIPSCTATILMNLLKMSKKEKIMIMATKAYKYYACSQIYYLVANYGMGTNRLINYFKVHKNTYSKFKMKLKLENPILLYKYKLKIPTINSFENERFENAVDLVKDFKEANNDLQTGSLLIRKWIFVNKNKRVSEKMINLIKREKPEVFKNSFSRDNSKKSSYFNESKKHNSYVRDDLIEMNYNTPNVVGVDGTNLKIELNNSSYKTKLNCMISYDWDLKTIVAYNFDKNENSNSSLKVFKRINEYSVNTNSNKVIQSDRGLAFSCEKIFEYVNKNNNIVHSMSKRGFKHNASTESLNRWVKEKFFKTYGCKFKNIQNFYDTFRKFVYNFNKLQFLKYNIFDQKNQHL